MSPSVGNTKLNWACLPIFWLCICSWYLSSHNGNLRVRSPVITREPEVIPARRWNIYRWINSSFAARLKSLRHREKYGRMLCTNFPTSTAPCTKKKIGKISNDRLNAGKGKILMRYVLPSVEVDDIRVWTGIGRRKYLRRFAVQGVVPYLQLQGQQSFWARLLFQVVYQNLQFTGQRKVIKLFPT